MKKLLVQDVLEILNAAFIRQGVTQYERLKALNEGETGQLRSLFGCNVTGKFK